MKRRSFLKGLLGAFGLGGVTLPVSSAHKTEEMVEVEYGKVFTAPGCDDLEMPGALRAQCDGWADSVSMVTGHAIARREYIWLRASHKDKSDPFGLTGVAGVKVWLFVPKRQYDAEVAVRIVTERWSQEPIQHRTFPLEFADFRIGGRLVRHWRIAV
jgi:hypothetical protein